MEIHEKGKLICIVYRGSSENNRSPDLHTLRAQHIASSNDRRGSTAIDRRQIFHRAKKSDITRDQRKHGCHFESIKWVKHYP